MSRRGKTYIDGIDLYSAFGIFITEGGYKGSVNYPSIKNPEYANDWPERDGIEVDSSEIRLDAKEFDITFGAIGSYKVGDFIELISDGAYHLFDFKEAGKSFRLRLVSQTNKSLYIGAESFSLKFSDDFPLEGYEYLEPKSSTVGQTGYEIDAVPFSRYGIFVCEGSDAQIMKSPPVKKNLLRNIPNENGAMYDGEKVVFQQKEVNINCCLIAKDLPEFWRNYYAFLYDLIRPVEITEDSITSTSRERRFYFDRNGEEYPCYYKSNKVSKFLPTDGDVWCEFVLTLVFTSFRIGKDEYLLAGENGELIVSEDGKYFFDMQYYGNN